LNVARTTTQKYVNFFVQDSCESAIADGEIRESATSRRNLPHAGVRLQAQEQLGARLGAAYDISGDGKTKAFGNFGIFYARVRTNLAARRAVGRRGHRCRIISTPP